MSVQRNGPTMSGCHLKRKSLATLSRQDRQEVERDLAYRQAVGEISVEEVENAMTFLRQHSELYDPRKVVRSCQKR